MEAKNIIVVMLDTLRPDHLGCYGNKWIKTPNFDQVARESNDPEQNHNIASDKPEVVKRMFDLILEDAGGPVLPNWKVDPLLLKVPGVQSIVEWTEWSPFREWHIPGE